MMNKSWRPKDWYKYSNEQPPAGSPSYESFEAGADALWDALMKYRVTMPPDFKPILIIIPSEEKR